MSIFTSRVPPLELKVPSEPDHTITIRKLAPWQLEKAAKVAQREAARDSAEHMEAMGGAESARIALKAYESSKAAENKDKEADTPAEVAAPPPDPTAGYDRLTLMREAFKSWTYDAPPNEETFKDIDEDTQAWLVKEILRFARPALFQTKAEAEDARFSG